MPTSGERWAVDTSVAIAALDRSHAAHPVCRALVVERRPALSGHAAFECYSVLTRMPGALGLDGPGASALLAAVFPDIVLLTAADSRALLGRLGPIGVLGGAVYDALVGEAARRNQRRLLTRDGRARRTYDLLGVDYELADS